MSNRSHPEIQAARLAKTLDGAKTCARRTKYCSNAPLIFQIDLEIVKFPRNDDICLDRMTDGQTQIEISTVHSSAQKTGSSELAHARQQ